MGQKVIVNDNSRFNHAPWSPAVAGSVRRARGGRRHSDEVRDHEQEVGVLAATSPYSPVSPSIPGATGAADPANSSYNQCR